MPGVVVGVLRNPTISDWDVTIERRFPIRGGQSGVRLQCETYNLFNQVQFTLLSAGLTCSGTNNQAPTSTTAGMYNTVINPRHLGVTMRVDV